MSSETAEDDKDPDVRDAALMRRLVLARARPDGALSVNSILSELLTYHQPNIRRIITYRVHSERPSKADIDEIVNTVMISVAKAFENDFDPNVPFGALVNKNIDWDVIDWVRARKRRAREISADLIVIADPELPEAPSLADEAERLGELIAELPERDRTIVAERMLLGLDPQRIAEIHGMSRGAVDTATSRALKKLSASEGVQAARKGRDVRDLAPPSVEKT